MSQAKTIDLILSVTLLVPGDGVARQLWPLIKAIAPNAPSTVRELSLQNDPDQAAGAGNGSLLVGDANLATSRVGLNMKFGDDHTFRATHNEGLSLSTFYVLAAGSSVVTLNIFGLRN